MHLFLFQDLIHNLTWYLVVMSPQSPVIYGNLCFSIFVYHDLGTFVKSWSVILQTIPKFDLSDVSHAHFQLMLFWQEYHKSDVPFLVICIRGICCQYVLLVMFSHAYRFVPQRVSSPLSCPSLSVKLLLFVTQCLPVWFWREYPFLTGRVFSVFPPLFPMRVNF